VLAGGANWCQATTRLSFNKLQISDQDGGWDDDNARQHLRDSFVYEVRGLASQPANEYSFRSFLIIVN
jgi:hypothetical protein